jgi:acyl-CoA synthetase (AMP-forming)/AMP-acid ligase II/acyl carrier protein
VITHRLTSATSLPPRHPPRTLAQLLQESIREHAQREAILAPGRLPLTYARLGQQLEETARALAAVGYGRGSRIAVALPAGPEFAVAALALTCAATCAPLNRALGEEGLATLLSAMRVDALLAEPDDAAAIRAAGRASVAVLRLRRSLHDCAGVFELEAERQRAPVPIEPVALDDIALLGHTSGTTARPKIVPYEQWRLAEAVRNRAEQRGFSSAERCLLVSPLHALGTPRRILIPPLLRGGSVLCPAALDGRSVVDALEALAPTQLFASPVLLQSMLEEFERRRPPPEHALRCIYASYSELPPTLRERLERTFGVPVFFTYGMSETTAIAETPFPPVIAPAGSVGRPTTLEVAVADEAGRQLGAGETGEIIVRGAEVIAGYENDDEANRQAFRDGWFRTGDAGWIDRDGFLYLSGRLKDIVNRGGMKIGPGEVESALACHPQVAEAAAFGLPHPTLGEDLAAAVVLRDGPAVDESELREFLLARLPSFKVPTLIFPASQLPRGSLDKVNRNELVKLAEQRMQTDFEAPVAGVETEVARIFAEVLSAPHVGRMDNFFRLGGDSLRGVRVLASIEEAFALSVSLDLLFDHPTVAALAGKIGDLLRTGPQATAGQRTSRNQP